MLLTIKNDYFQESFYNLQHEQYLTAIVVGATWYKTFYWMKLFNTPAFFINLLQESFADPNFKAFSIMLFLLMFTFMNVFYIMNQERGGKYAYSENDLSHNEELYTEDLDLGLVNAFIYVYKITLGDFSTNKFLGLNSEFIWLLFFLATFLLQIVFLNMLIAIMGNTFQFVLDNKQESSMKERISILSDFRLLIRALKLDSEFSYLFILEKDQDSLESEWMGELTEMKMSFDQTT